LEKTGLYDAGHYDFPFLSAGENYTVFIPTEEALTSYGAADLPLSELEAFLRYHFVKGHIIFTDGNKPWQDYETMRKDETSTEFNTRYSTLDIRPGYDMIEILDSDGVAYVTIPEEAGKTNKIIAMDTDNESFSIYDYISTGVAHEIDTVLIKQ
jgi:hypothetical protein